MFKKKLFLLFLSLFIFISCNFKNEKENNSNKKVELENEIIKENENLKTELAKMKSEKKIQEFKEKIKKEEIEKKEDFEKKTETEEKTENKESEDLKIKKDTTSIKSSKELQEIYSKWVIPDKNLKYNFSCVDKNLKTDCVFMYNEDIGKGDLLSTLIAKDDVRKKCKLSIYSPQYLANLENNIVKKISKQRGEKTNFYASSVCHLEKDIDILTGILKSKKNYDHVLVISHKNNIFWYHENYVKLYDNTATGGEVGPCSGKVIDNNIIWECFLGLHNLNNDIESGPSFEHYIISLDNKTIIKKDGKFEK